MNNRSIGIGTLLLMAGITHAAAQTAPALKLSTEEFMAPSKQPEIQLYIRNKHREDMHAFSPERTVLFVHGATYPSETTFDLPVGGASWMDQIAARGFDVYLVDLPGYGRSSRPAEMSKPADASGPIVDTDAAVAAVGAAVDFILQRRNIPRTNLIGWSWGTTIMAKYTTQNVQKVQRLALYAPIWIWSPPAADVSKLCAGLCTSAYRTVPRQEALSRWLQGVPEDKKADLIPAGVFDMWWNATIASDPVGAAADPPALRAPNGVMYDILNNWVSGKTMFDPARITVPTILAVAEWDQDTKPYMAQTLFPLLTNAPQKRLVIVGEGTHTLLLEKNRMALITEVQKFFEENFAN
jgi:pimeloyl-ACP methyl ester carboxylesterase